MGKRRAGWTAALILALAAVPASAVEGRLDMADGDLRDAVSAGSLALNAVRDDDSTPLELVAAARADYANILSILYAEGHYAGVIHIYVDGREAADLSPFGAPTAVRQVVVAVDPGPQFLFGRAELAPVPRGTDLPDEFASGQPARADTVRDAVGAGVDAWREEGHAKARVAAQQIVAVHPRRQLDAAVRLDPGPRLTFGRLIVQGNEDVRTARIHEIAGLRTGRVFSPEDLDTVARRLRNTGAFRSVALEEAERPNPDGSLDITATVVEELPRRFGFGAEINSFEGLAVTGFWMHRNLFGGAERLRFDAEIRGIGGDSGTDYILAADFRRPGTFSAPNTLYLRARIAQEDEPAYFLRSGEIEAGIVRELSARTRFSYGVAYEFAEVTDDLGTRRFSLLSLPLTGEHDRRDDPLDATEGFFVRLEATPFHEFNSGATGGRLYADGRYYRSFGAEDRVTLAGRLVAGSVLGAEIDEVPPDMLFLSGGGGTVRGQPYQSLAVDLGGGNEIGGRNLVVASAEVRVRLRERIQVVGFADYGFVGASSVPGQDGDSHAGAGLGLRYLTPIGPLRLDVAAPVYGDTGEGVQLYLGIGQAF